MQVSTWINMLGPLHVRLKSVIQRAYFHFCLLLCFGLLQENDLDIDKLADSQEDKEGEGQEDEKEGQEDESHKMDEENEDEHAAENQEKVWYCQTNLGNLDH